MAFWVPLLATLLSAPAARGAEGGVVTRIVGSLDGEIDLFADCDRAKKKPLLLASSGGTVRQISLKCREGTGTFDVYLSYQPKSGEPGKDFLKEVFLKATNPDAEARLLSLADEIGAEAKARELAFVKYRNAAAVTDLTVSLGGFSWDLLSGPAYYDKLKSLAERQSSVILTDPVTLKVPGAGSVVVAVTTFGADDGMPMTQPAWSVVHLVGEDGAAVRFPLKLSVVPGGQTAKLSAFPISADESVMKYQGPMESTFYRLDPASKAFIKLALVERSTSTKDSDVRFALMPSVKTNDGHYSFDLVRVEVRRDAAGNVRGTSERVVGRCLYDVARKDYVCPNPQ